MEQGGVTVQEPAGRKYQQYSDGDEGKTLQQEEDRALFREDKSEAYHDVLQEVGGPDHLPDVELRLTRLTLQVGDHEQEHEGSNAGYEQRVYQMMDHGKTGRS